LAGLDQLADQQARILTGALTGWDGGLMRH
jgi:hypothetical protein